MNAPKIPEALLQSRGRLRCPLCRGSGGFRDFSFVCESGHCFDISAKGYLNLAPRQRETKYDANLFESRRAVFESGLYGPVLELVREMAGEGGVILDAGCGEGYYAAALAGQAEAVIGMDLERRAVQLAAKKSRQTAWLVGDIENIPLADSSVSLVLNILTPANYAEFFRVLRPGGRILKLIPGGDYLREVRAAVRERLKAGEYSSDRVWEHFCRSVKNPARRGIRIQSPLTRELAAHLFRMTPMTMHLEPTEQDLQAISTATLHLYALTGEKP